MDNFHGFGLSAKLMTALQSTDLKKPTPIQSKAIPHIMQGRDLLGLAQTGTGKTAAFGLPLLHRLLDLGHPPGPRNVRALILAPTRELVSQINDSLLRFTKGTAVKVVMVVGGQSLNRQADNLARGADVLIATPGRLLDLLGRGMVNLQSCGYLVLDEADHMLDMGFIHALRQIAKHIPLRRQTLMFSATMPKDIDEISAAYLRDPIRVEVTPPGKEADRLSQGVHFIPNGDKARLLETYLKRHPEEQSLVFCRTKHGSDKLAKLLGSWGFGVDAIHGNRTQNQRNRILNDFRSGDLLILVATDVAARGIDVPGVRHVYNYDLPNVPENYVHRIGRTARAGKEGESISFCAPAEMDELKEIEKNLKKPLPILGGAPWAVDVVAADHARKNATRKNAPNARAKRPERPAHAAKKTGKPPAQSSSTHPAPSINEGTRAPFKKPQGPKTARGRGSKHRG